MRSSSAANSFASSPPAPARISRMHVLLVERVARASAGARRILDQLGFAWSRGAGPPPGPSRASPRRPSRASRRASASSSRALSSSRQAATTGSSWDISLPRRLSAAGSECRLGRRQLAPECASYWVAISISLASSLAVAREHRLRGQVAFSGDPAGATRSRRCRPGSRGRRRSGPVPARRSRLRSCRRWAGAW